MKGCKKCKEIKEHCLKVIESENKSFKELKSDQFGFCYYTGMAQNILKIINK